jgi:phage recombination protein Bet
MDPQPRPTATREADKLFDLPAGGAGNATALEVIGQRTGEIASFTTRFTSAQVQIIRNVYAKDLTDDEFVVFVYQSERRGLDPTNGQIHAVVRGKGENRSLSIQTGIAGFRLISQRTGRDRGRLGPMWCGPDGKWVDVWLKKEHPAAAKCGVRTTSNPEGSWAVVTWDEVAQKTYSGELNRFWKEMGPTMIAKCAEAAIRRTEFPEELSGLYIDEEMKEDDNRFVLVGTPPPAGPTDTRPREPMRSQINETPLEAREKQLWREAKALELPIPSLPPNLPEKSRVSRCDWLEARIAYRKLTIQAETEYNIPVEKLADKVSVAQIQQAIAALQKAIAVAPKPVGVNEELFPTDGTG